MLAAQSELERRLGARVDAAVGRQPGAIIDRLQSYLDANALPPNVVVQLGDNGPVWSADMKRLRTVLRGVPHVVLVDIREPNVSWQGEVSGILAQYVAHWPRATIADWLSASGDPNLTYDGAHPNTLGATVYARVIARAFRRLIAAAPDPPATAAAVRAQTGPAGTAPTSTTSPPESTDPAPRPLDPRIRRRTSGPEH